MPRKGRFLEVLVKHLQEFLGPQGLEVKSPERFYQNSKLIGEIDVTIRGKLGSATIFVGIECRDRPGEKNPPGIPWLTQIHGKQELFKVDKMIAVSTTGFAPEAEKVAQDFGIDLLAVEDDAEHINLAGWFNTIDFHFDEEMYDISGQIEISTEPKTAAKTLSFRRDTPFLRLNAREGLISLDEFMKPELDTLFGQLPKIDNGVVEKEAVIQRTEQIHAELAGQQFKITRLSIPIRLSREVVSGRLLLNICKSLNPEEVVAITGKGTFQTSKRKLKVLAIAKKSPVDANLRDLRFVFLTEDDKPYNLLQGAVFTLYGRE